MGKRVLAAFVLLPLFLKAQAPARRAPAFHLINFTDQLGYGDGSSSISEKNGRIDIVDVELRHLVATAFGVPLDRVSQSLEQSPKHFAISFQLDDFKGRTKSELLSEQQVVLQTILADKEGLHAHIVETPENTYVLQLARGGAKLSRGGVGVSGQVFLEGGGYAGKPRSEAVQITARGVSIDWLAEQLTGDANRPVLNQTSLPGRYYFNLKWAVSGNREHDFTSLQNALKLSLGLEIVPKIAPLSRVVIDSIN
jgi:uncharacterized protein (TIGR03435 family)